MNDDVMAADEYAGLHRDIVGVVEAAHITAACNVTAVMTAVYWEIGRR